MKRETTSDRSDGQPHQAKIGFWKVAHCSQLKLKSNRDSRDVVSVASSNPQASVTVKTDRWGPSSSQIVARTPFRNPTDSARPGRGSPGCSSYSKAATPLNLTSKSARTRPGKSMIPRPSGCPSSLRVRRGNVLDMQVEQAVSAIPDRAQQVSSDANGVADVDAQADPVVERLDRVVDALGSREVTVARTVVVNRDR